MNDEDLDLRIYARRGSTPRMPVRPARAPAPAVAQTPPAAPARTPPMAPARASSTEELPAVRPDEAPIWLPEPPEPPRRVTEALPVAAPEPVAELILRILRAPPEWGETVEGAFTRKERELAAAFEALAPAAAGELFHRLSNPPPDDPVAESFERLVPERRGRLLANLAAAPRRAAIARAGRRPSQPRRSDG
jgi:hypothetical protein